MAAFLYHPMSFLIYGYDTIKQCHVRGKNSLCIEEKKLEICRISSFCGLTRSESYPGHTTIFGWCSSKAPFGLMDSPSQSQCISFNVTFFSSSGVSGQWKESLSRRFISIQKPDPSHWSILIEVRLRLQNANMHRE